MRQLLLGFANTQLLYVAARLGLPDLLSAGPKTSDELAGEVCCHPQALHRVLRGLVGIKVINETDDGRFALAPLGQCLQSNSPGSLQGFAIFVGERQYPMWQSLIHCVQTGETAYRHQFGMETFEYLEKHPEAGEVFNRGMSSITAGIVSAVVSAYDFSSARTLVDVGGSHGVLIAAILRANPSVHGILFDLPHVLNGAVPNLERSEVIDRCTLVPGDFFESVPEGGDLYLLKSIIHDWDEERGIAILKVCRRGIARGGRLLLIEPILPERVEQDPGIIWADVNMLVMTGGKERTAAEYRSLLAAAGFDLQRIIPTSSLWSIIEAVPV